MLQLFLRPSDFPLHFCFIFALETLPDNFSQVAPVKVADSVDDYSDTYGDYYLDNLDGCLVGIAPEAQVARERVLEARVRSALESGNPFEFNGKVYAPVSGVSLK